MYKGLNLDGPNYGTGSAGHYDEQAREFCRQTGTRAIALWASWRDAQPTPGSGYSLPDVDAQYRQARADGLTVLITPGAYPDWCKPPGNRPPRDTSPSGPWARWMGHVMRQYPDAVVVILNEPNFGFIDDPQRFKAMARMTKTAARVARLCGGRHILTPAFLDSEPKRDAEKFLRALNWPFGKRRGWRPPSGVTVGWATHPYADVNDREGAITGVRDVLDLLRAYRWHAGARLWCTEGGYKYRTTGEAGVANPTQWSYVDEAGDAKIQEQRLVRHIGACRRDGRVEGWFNYELPATLWAGWDTGLLDYHGQPRPISARWGSL